MPENGNKLPFQDKLREMAAGGATQLRPDTAASLLLKIADTLDEKDAEILRLRESQGCALSDELVARLAKLVHPCWNCGETLTDADTHGCRERVVRAILEELGSAKQSKDSPSLNDELSDEEREWLMGYGLPVRNLIGAFDKRGREIQCLRGIQQALHSGCEIKQRAEAQLADAERDGDHDAVNRLRIVLRGSCCE